MMNTVAAKDIIPLLDLTSLNDSDNESSTRALCKKAVTAHGHVAAVCVYPQWVSCAREALAEFGATDIELATVVNFPQGNDDQATVLAQTKRALDDGATEIDVVIPYQALIDGDEESPAALLKAVCELTHQRGALVKVILETGALESEKFILLAAGIAVDAGADFLKTSTGKIATGATVEAVDLLVETISAKGVADHVGIKVSGGVRSKADADAYLDLIIDHLGKDWLSAAHFRFGASSLLDDLLDQV
ncbi:deoxyribose-phosphate aldolase [Suttonella sp. R2A3]|uniref:deoxyribose-phosphate aldolase n=1 Tax=Suttonella sp. R2A3 TaxID=2908648 RepID=UPI001F3002EF|nr:deoxyribose-phosphate aldolase [Suttonella sp. R2A3]UJF24402.1 deoxyribose-phosphate aldolase [Suttonella sp. R2A3]